jgi:hypothetical protein
MHISPPTFLGGNPFILTEHVDGKGALPTWPIWVPEKVESDQEFRRQLTQLEADHSPRAAGIYLGWALHLLTDLAQPYHVVNKTGVGHSAFEHWVDDVLESYKHLPMIDGQYKFHKGPVYDQNNFRKLVTHKKLHQTWKFSNATQRIMRESERRFQSVRKGSSRDEKKAALEYLLDMAIKECVYAILNLGKQTPPKMETYHIVIKTARVRNAATRAIPYIILIGDGNKSLLKELHIGRHQKQYAERDWRRLIRSGLKPHGLFKFYGAGYRYYQTKGKPHCDGTSDGNLSFKDGSISRFRVRIPHGLGELRGIAIGHDGQGYKPAWAIDYIEILDPRGKQWTWRNRGNELFFIGENTETSVHVNPGFSPEIRMADITEITPILPLKRMYSDWEKRQNQVPLKRYWSSSRKDNFVTATEEGDLSAFKSRASHDHR